MIVLECRELGCRGRDAVSERGDEQEKKGNPKCEGLYSRDIAKILTKFAEKMA